MNFKQCLIFREIAKTNNFTKAANNLYLTQSAVSHAMKDLENEAGTQFFERLHRSVRLTPAGELFLKEIQPIIEEFEAVEAHLPNLEKQPPIKIASCITYAQTELPQLLHKFSDKHPAGSFNVQVFPASESIALLEKGEVDIAFIEGHVLQPAFEAKKLLTTVYVSWQLKDLVMNSLALRSFYSNRYYCENGEVLYEKPLNRLQFSKASRFFRFGKVWTHKR